MAMRGEDQPRVGRGWCGGGGRGDAEGGGARGKKHLQYDQLARLERQNREQGKANHKACEGAKVAGTEYEETVPSAHCYPSC